MLNPFTWQGWWTNLALLSAVYYLSVFLLFRNKTTAPATAKDPLFEDPPQGSEESLVYRCVDELSAYFGEAKKTRPVPEEFLFAVRSILSRYPFLQSSAYKEAVANVIQSEAAHHCSLHLGEEEMQQLWKKG